MRYFDKEQVERLLDMGGCINAMRKALTQYSLGSAVQVLRTAMPFAPGKILGVMPAALPDSGLVGAKLRQRRKEEACIPLLPTSTTP